MSPSWIARNSPTGAGFQSALAKSGRSSSLETIGGRLRVWAPPFGSKASNRAASARSGPAASRNVCVECSGSVGVQTLLDH